MSESPPQADSSPERPPEQFSPPVEAGKAMATHDGLGVRPADTRINDVEKAHTMAIAEDPFRTKAAESRALTRPSHELTTKINEFSQVHDQLHPENRLKRKERQALEEEDRRLTAAIDDENSAAARKYSVQNPEMARQFDEDFPDESEIIHTLVAPNPDSRAKFYDAQASRIGDWAGRLHDKPLSEEFRAAYRDIEISPESLVRFEDEAQRLGRAITAQEAQAKPRVGREVNSLIEYSGQLKPEHHQGKGATETVGELLAETDPAKAERWKDITERLRGAATEADEFYRELVQEIRIKPLKNQLALVRNLLHDVEHATEVKPEPEPDSEPSDPSSS